MKECTKCRIRKRNDEFYYNWTKKDKRENKCKVCMRFQKKVFEIEKENLYQQAHESLVLKQQNIEERKDIIEEVIESFVSYMSYDINLLDKQLERNKKEQTNLSESYNLHQVKKTEVPL